MSYTNTTPNYSLPQYVGTDKPSFLGDFNSAMRTIDEALEANKTTAGDAAGKLAEDENLLQETQHRANDAKSAIEALEGTVNNVSTTASDASEKATQAFNKATEAQSEVAAANVTSGNNKTTLDGLTERVKKLEAKAKVIYKEGAGPWNFSDEFPGGVNFDLGNLKAVTSGWARKTVISPREGNEASIPEMNLVFAGEYNNVTVSQTFKEDESQYGWGWRISDPTEPGIIINGCLYIIPEE